MIAGSSLSLLSKTCSNSDASPNPGIRSREPLAGLTLPGATVLEAGPTHVSDAFGSGPSVPPQQGGGGAGMCSAVLLPKLLPDPLQNGFGCFGISVASKSV